MALIEGIEQKTCNQIALCSEVPPRCVVELSVKAVHNSATIKAIDKHCDPLHYYLGMLGKRAILGVVKNQASKQGMNPDEDLKKLDWKIIFRQVLQKITPRMHYLISIAGCLRWCEERVRIYKENFPTYDYYGTAMDQLIRYYSYHLTALKETAKFSDQMWVKLCWQNIFAVSTLDVAKYIQNQSDDKDKRQVSKATKEELINRGKHLSSVFCITEEGKIEFQQIDWTQSNEQGYNINANPKTDKGKKTINRVAEERKTLVSNFTGRGHKAPLRDPVCKPDKSLKKLVAAKRPAYLVEGKDAKPQKKSKKSADPKKRT